MNLINKGKAAFLELVGTYHYARRNFQVALRITENAAKLDPTRANIWANKGYYHYLLHQFEDAYEAYSIALKLNENHLGAMLLAGNTLEQLGRHKEALQYYERLLAANCAKGWSQAVIDAAEDRVSKLKQAGF